MKYSFKNDYTEGCHPSILEALLQTNMQQQAGYGNDIFCEEAAQLILKKAAAPESKVHFVSGGTQANLIVISALLRPHESVVAAQTGHIFTNEAGAIEATGHKVHAVNSTDGKLCSAAIQEVIAAHQNIPHQVKQKMVYISNSTEIGTIYRKAELEALYSYCKSKDLYLFMDGARLAQALTADTNDLSLADVARLTDVFYLGGTKNGALLGEAIVINNPALQAEFGYHIKQKGAMLAKGRVLGLQFHTLLQNDLYFGLGKHANQQAMKIKAAFQKRNCDFLAATFTNQIFPILTTAQIEKLSQDFDFYVWRKIEEDRAAVRIITSWATPDAATDAFCNAILNL